MTERSEVHVTVVCSPQSGEPVTVALSVAVAGVALMTGSCNCD